MHTPTLEEEVVQGMRPWPQAQELFRGPAFRRLANYVDVGWYDTALDGRGPAFCMVRDGAGAEFEELLGEVLRIVHGDREAFVYCLGSRNLPPNVDIALTRRAFLAVSLLTASSIPAVVEVVR